MISDPFKSIPSLKPSKFYLATFIDTYLSSEDMRECKVLELGSGCSTLFERILQNMPTLNMSGLSQILRQHIKLKKNSVVTKRYKSDIHFSTRESLISMPWNNDLIWSFQ